MPQDLIIAGVHRSSTTAVFNHLAGLPHVSPSRIKETNFFLPARYDGEIGSLEDYDAFFDNGGQRNVRVEASPGYFCGGAPVADAINGLLPDARILVILREPMARVESFYTFMRSILAIPRDMSFPDYVTHCLSLSNEELASKEMDMYRGVHDGLYADYYQPWVDIFGDRIRFFFFDDFVERPAVALRDIGGWLGIDAPALTAHLSKDNSRSNYRVASLQRRALQFNIKFEPWLRKHPRVKGFLRATYRAVNGGAVVPPEVSFGDPVSPALAELRALYGDANRRLAERMDRDFPQTARPAWLST